MVTGHCDRPAVERHHGKSDARAHLALQLLDDVVAHRVLLITEVRGDHFLGALPEVLREVHDHGVLLHDGRIISQDRGDIERLARCPNTRRHAHVSVGAAAESARPCQGGFCSLVVQAIRGRSGVRIKRRYRRARGGWRGGSRQARACSVLVSGGGCGCVVPSCGCRCLSRSLARKESLLSLDRGVLSIPYNSQPDSTTPHRTTGHYREAVRPMVASRCCGHD